MKSMTVIWLWHISIVISYLCLHEWNIFIFLHASSVCYDDFPWGEVCSGGPPASADSPTAERLTDFINPALWLWQNRDTVPLLSALVYTYSCVQASSTPSERVFPTAGDAIRPERPRIFSGKSRHPNGFTQEQLILFLSKRVGTCLSWLLARVASSCFGSNGPGPIAKYEPLL